MCVLETALVDAHRAKGTHLRETDKERETVAEGGRPKQR